MRQLVYITLTTVDGFPVHIEHRELTTICEMQDATEAAGFLVSESFEDILKKLREAYELAGE